MSRTRKVTNYSLVKSGNIEGLVNWLMMYVLTFSVAT